MIPESIIDKIKSIAQIKDFCTTAKGYGQNRLIATCPACGYYNEKKKQGLNIDVKKNVAHCFSPTCGVHYSGAIDFVMKTENLSYPDALRFVAKQYAIFIEETAETPKETGKRKPKKTATPAAPIISEPVAEPLDKLFYDAAELIFLKQSAATSLIQRKFEIGYQRSGKIMDQLESAGIVGPSHGTGARLILPKTLTDLNKLIDQARNPQPITDPAPEEKPVLDPKIAKKKAKLVATAKPDQEPEKKPVQPGAKTFCDTQLAESGLTYDDIRIETTDETGTTRYISPFIQGTRDQFNNIIEHRYDDVLIRYYDLDARPVMYKPKEGAQMKPLVRVRWQNPAAHLDKDGEPIKYQSPGGSGSHVYIPEALRKMYKHSRKIKRLYLQEGEKKAEKSCKHGIMSIGIMGINNLGTDGRLPDEIQLIVQRCEVEEVVFVLDSDWRNLSEKLENGKSVDTRPRQFFAAVRSFKEYLRTLANLNLSVEIYFGFIKFNDARAKGIDDLLVTVLAEKETELPADFDFAVNDKNGSGKYVQVNKITMLPDDKIADFWLLNDAEKFADYHKKRLETLKEFKIKGFLRKFDEKGMLVMCQQLFKEEQFWDEQEKEDRQGNTKTTLIFDYVNAMNFLQRRGFWRYEMRNGDKDLVRIENRVIQTIDHTVIKDFTKDFCREIKRLDVLNMLMRGGPQYLGPEKLSNLDITRPPIERAYYTSQDLFFREKIWEINAEGIKELNYGQFSEYVWSEKIIKHRANALPPMLEITVMTDELRRQLPDAEAYASIENGEFFIDYSADAKNCHFLQFLINCSNFNWRKKELTLEDQFLNSRHLINKLTAIGYLLHDFKDDSEQKAIIAVDGKISEVGNSNGGSGKSIVGDSIGQLIPQVIIDGKSKKLDDDNFKYNDVTEKTKNLFFDDVRANWEFESVFSIITNGMTVNQKSGKRFPLSKQETPKLYISTNHMLNGSGSSFTRRQAYIVFSDFYNAEHQPIHDFGVNFFSEWDSNQRNLFFNLMATCLVLYFKSKQNGWSGTKRIGIVPPPMEDVEKRQLRQLMGENFLTWADAYFYWDNKTKSGNLNQRHVRLELFTDFKTENPIEAKYITPAKFKDKVLAYCAYCNLDFNPKQRNHKDLDIVQYYKTNPEGHFIGKDDKTGGKEYFTLANKDFNESF